MDSRQRRTCMGSSTLGDKMEELINSYKSQIDINEVKDRFPEMTESETPIWYGGPVLMSMAGKYALSLLVLLVHVIFFWAAKFEDVEGQGNLNVLVGLAKVILDVSGVLGFVIVMMLIAKINHYLNTSTSGGWTTTWLIVNGLIPFTIVILDWGGKIIGNFTDGIPDTPMWLDWYYPVLGLLSASFSLALTTHYRKSFQYAITDKRVHIRKKFLYFDSSTIGIPFEKVENLKVEPPIIGKIFGFGNIHVITDGIQSESRNEDQSGRVSSPLLSILFGWVFMQRKKSPSTEDPSQCLFCINDPMSVYSLINELIDNS